MYRSFTDRIFGGVCGGLARDFRVNVWALRATFIVLTALTLGLAALVYVALWWAMPQESLIADRHGSLLRLLLAAGIVVSMAGAWIGDHAGWLKGPSGQSLYWPVILVILSAVFLLRQVKN